MRFFYGCAVLLSLLFGSIAFSEESAPPVKVEVTADHKKVTAGQDFIVLVKFKLEPKWHVYWKNPGATGVAPTIEWKLPKGVSVKKMEWSTPEKFNLDGIETYGYSDSASLLVTLHVDENLTKLSPLDILGDVQWVACSDETCLPGLEEIQLSLEMGSAPKQDIESKAKMEEAKASVPQKVGVIKTVKKDNLFYLSSDEIAMNEKEPAQFFPETGIDKSSEPSVDEANHQITIESSSPNLKGVLVMGENAYDIDVTSDPYQEVLNFGIALLFAILGGLILNLMPCVLPVVSLKMMSFMKMAKESRLELMKQGFLFTAGVLVSFWVLAGILILLQLSGEAVGWGFQLQEPLFIATLAMLFSLMALSLFGVFELGTSVAAWAGNFTHSPKERSQSLASFTSGIFATIVATPCTGPFMGSALGYALTQPIYVSFAIFTALGIGMSLPYILVGIFPSLIRWLPKPGAWMETFKQFLGFLMLATVIWLLWVYVSQTSLEALFLMLGALLLLSLGAWVFGRFASPSRKKNIRRIGTALALIALIGSFELGYLGTVNGENSHTVETTDLAWEPFSEARIEELRAQNIPVIVDFTAKWCLICQANHVILNQESVAAKMDEKKVVRMKADWTKRDPAITAALKKHGRNGVPLYLFYSGEKEADPIVLPQVLTADHLIRTFDTVPDSNVR